MNNFTPSLNCFNWCKEQEYIINSNGIVNNSSWIWLVWISLFSLIMYMIIYSMEDRIIDHFKRENLELRVYYGLKPILLRFPIILMLIYLIRNLWF